MKHMSNRAHLARQLADSGIPLTAHSLQRLQHTPLLKVVTQLCLAYFNISGLCACTAVHVWCYTEKA